MKTKKKVSKQTLILIILGVVLLCSLGYFLLKDKISCVKEGESLGAVIPGNHKQCCGELEPYIPVKVVGTRGTCVTFQEKIRLEKEDNECISNCTNKACGDNDECGYTCDGSCPEGKSCQFLPYPCIVDEMKRCNVKDHYECVDNTL